MPRVLSVSPLRPDPAIIAEACSVLAAGRLVAFPTETVYGLGARGLRGVDVARIFEAKGRPANHPLILHVSSMDTARDLAAGWPDQATRLARAFWPGPLTLVVRRAAHVPEIVSGGLDTVGIRAPQHPVALALLTAMREPLAAPSANAHTHVSPTTAAHVVRSLGERVDLVLDAGPTSHGIESTVVDVSDRRARVLRAGAASLAALRAVVPEIEYEPTIAEEGASRASPGLAGKHYAPRVRVLIAASGADFAASCRGPGRVGAISWSQQARRSLEAASSHEATELSLSIVLPAAVEDYARALFAALHDADEAQLDVLVIEAVPDSPEWWAIRDRLRRAAYDA